MMTGPFPKRRKQSPLNAAVLGTGMMIFSLVPLFCGILLIAHYLVAGILLVGLALMVVVYGFYQWIFVRAEAKHFRRRRREYQNRRHELLSRSQFGP